MILYIYTHVCNISLILYIYTYVCNISLILYIYTHMFVIYHWYYLYIYIHTFVSVYFQWTVLTHGAAGHLLLGNDQGQACHGPMALTDQPRPEMGWGLVKVGESWWKLVNMREFAIIYPLGDLFSPTNSNLVGGLEHFLWLSIYWE